MNIADLKAWISLHFWKGEQIADWAKRTFYERILFQSARTGSESANLPVKTDSDGYIDSTFLGSTLIAELIADTVGAMVTGNTETGISVVYQDGDNTLDFDAQTAGDARYARLVADNTLTGQQALTSSVGPHTAERTSSATTTTNAALGLIHTTSGNMADGFGSSLLFYIRDNAAVLNPIGLIEVIRNGADNTGRLKLNVFSAGVATLVADFTAAGLQSPTIVTPTITVRDNVLTIQDNSDPTKQLQFQLSGITTATTRTLTVPDASTTLVGTDATQTLTNKTLTTPTIADFTNMVHDHLDTNDGGTLTAPAISASNDIDAEFGGSASYIFPNGIRFVGGGDILDTYDEGTWSVVVADAASGGNTATPGSIVGNYTKFGDIVWAHCEVININTTGLTAGNVLHLRNFPFTATSRGVCAAFIQTTTFTSFVMAEINNTTSYITFREFTSGGAANQLTVSDFTDDQADVIFTLIYKA